MSDQTNPSFDDLCKLLHITPNPDGTITRHDSLALALHTSPTSDSSSPVLSKDVTINQTNNTWARIYIPNKALNSSTIAKLPLIIYFHSGGFILFSAASSLLQMLCEKIASELPAIVFSVSYRLAPENRLPAQYDDAMEAFEWIKTSQDVWLRQYADYGNCFLLGSSSGGNIVYHAGLRVAEAAGQSNLDPLKIKGLILHEPFFGGTQKTESEVKNEGDPLLVRGITDLSWEFALPVGADRDHEYCNPSGSKGLDIMKLNEWRVLVTGFEEDPLVDRQKEVVRMMKEKGVEVKSEFRGGGFHGIELLDPNKCEEFVLVLKDFVESVVSCV